MHGLITHAVSASLGIEPAHTYYSREEPRSNKIPILPNPVLSRPMVMGELCNTQPQYRFFRNVTQP